MTYTDKFEDVIADSGGCGRFQWVVTLLIHLSKVSAAWSMLAMTYMGQQPDFHCDLSASHDSPTSPVLRVNTSRWNNGSDSLSTCDVVNMTKCPGYVYDSSMKTTVDAFNLVCDRKWIVATITTIQMAGVLIGCFVSGQLGDVIGRKPTYFLSLVILFVFNIVAYFSVNWPMYAAIRFILGVGVAFFLTTNVPLILEFMPTIWRPRAIAIPSWPIEAGLFAMITWLLKDWKNVHLATAAVALPFLFSYRLITESSRWLITKKRYNEAEIAIQKVARINGKPEQDLAEFFQQAKEEIKSAEHGQERSYSVLDLFKTRERMTLTFSELFIWLSGSYAYYSLTFGIQSLSGDLYLNMLLMNTVDIPFGFCTMFLVNKFGRKPTCFVFTGLTGLAGLAVGIVQYIDTPSRPVVTNVFAFLSRVAMGIAWGANIIYTQELYPTVVRSVSYGLHNTAARVGSMIAPQIVYLNDDIPGLLYFLSAAMMLISAALFLFFPETKGRVLDDNFEDDVNAHTPATENGEPDIANGDTKS